MTTILNIKLTADWRPYERRPTWSVVSSVELAKVLNVSHQNLANLKLRGYLPAPVTDNKLKGNKNYFRISSIRSWLENKSEFEIHADWVKQYISSDPITLNEAEYLVSQVPHFFNVEKPLISANF